MTWGEGDLDGKGNEWTLLFHAFQETIDSHMNA